MCGGCAPATGINSPPEGGVHNPLRASLARSPPRLGRSQAEGLHPRPPGLRPWRAFAHRAPAASATQPEGSGHGCDGGGGGQPLAVVHARRLAPPPLPWIQFSKARQPGVGKPQALSTGERRPCSGGGGQTPAPPAGRLSPWVGSGVVHGQSGPQGRAPAPPGTRFPPAAGSALCRFIRENDSCEFGKNPALARARARLLVFFS